MGHARQNFAVDGDTAPQQPGAQRHAAIGAQHGCRVSCSSGHGLLQPRCTCMARMGRGPRSNAHACWCACSDLLSPNGEASNLKVTRRFKRKFEEIHHVVAVSQWASPWGRAVGSLVTEAPQAGPADQTPQQQPRLQLSPSQATAVDTQPGHLCSPACYTWLCLGWRAWTGLGVGW